MLAHARGFGFRILIDLTTHLGDLFQKIGMLLNCVGSSEQALKGLLIQLQLWPVRGHENEGRMALATAIIIVQVRKVRTGKFDWPVDQGAG
jgi:hypothetical protein